MTAQTGQPQPIATTTISTSLIGHLRFLYESSLGEMARRTGVRHGINGHSRHGLPAYIVAVAAVEAFLNEWLLGDFSRRVLSHAPLWRINNNTLDRMELTEKLFLAPQLLLGRTFDKGAMPYQDMMILAKVRNDIVHYRMRNALPNYAITLEQKQVILTAHPNPDNANYVWPTRLDCSEGIRWAHNTACATIVALIDFTQGNRRRGVRNLRLWMAPRLLRPFFANLIDEPYVRRRLAELGVDTSVDDPPAPM